MRGKWIKRVRHHECNPPQWRRIGSGSIWRCKCGLAYEARFDWTGRFQWRCIGPDHEDGAQ